MDRRPTPGASSRPEDASRVDSGTSPVQFEDASVSSDRSSLISSVYLIPDERGNHHRNDQLFLSTLTPWLQWRTKTDYAKGKSGLDAAFRERSSKKHEDARTSRAGELPSTRIRQATAIADDEETPAPPRPPLGPKAR